MLFFGIPEGQSCELDTLSNQAVLNTEHLNDATDPAKVKEHRKELIPVMLKARSMGKRAVLIRDKLFICNRLYTPGS
ncbi:hypothetical protein MAR_010604 [Mya arenaria]|uniref:Uncharacterized protein n=1 Tax=Mya arenaria TaxID=6604 RepID=A0ABY7EA67_MYAAR|nr:hypothetical protein MAR_010604 [Mya arenaria]